MRRDASASKVAARHLKTAMDWDDGPGHIPNSPAGKTLWKVDQGVSDKIQAALSSAGIRNSVSDRGREIETHTSGRQKAQLLKIMKPWVRKGKVKLSEPHQIGGRHQQAVEPADLVASTKTAGARFDAGARWQAQDEDGYYYDVTIDKRDIAGLGKLYDAAWRKHWAKALKKLEDFAVGVIPSSDNFKDVRAAYEYAFGDVDKDEGNLAGDVWAAVYYPDKGIEGIGSNYFSGRGGDSPSREDFELKLDDQVREELWSNAQDELKRVKRDFSKKVIEMWIGELRSTYWD